jgi:hypothetical protein
MSKTTVTDAINFNRANPDVIVAAGELVDMRFKTGSVMSLRAAKLFCLLGSIATKVREVPQDLRMTSA